MSAAESPQPRIRWYNSLIVRIILLCVVLVLCLLGSVIVITQYYTREMVQEMETQAQALSDELRLHVEANPQPNWENLETALMGKHAEFDEIRIEPDKDAVEVSPFTIERGDKGQWTKVARVALLLKDGRRVLLTVRETPVAHMEIVRAFKNKYLAMLAAVFLVALGLLVSFVVRLLRPLGELSERCARIGSGQLEPVTVRRNTGEILALEQTFNRMVESLREKETMEANLRQAHRLSALGNLAAGVAHDVRNPLNSIKLLSAHAIDTLGDAPGTAPAVKQLTIIRKEVQRVEEIVSGFLSLAKERELQPEPCRVDALLEECVRLIRKEAEAREVHLVAELRAGDATLMLDPKLWTRAVLNVLINALEATPKGGRVRLFSRVTFTACEVEIRDDGPGMSKDVADRAFDPYFTTKPTGTGLGLSIARGIIEEHGGTVWLTSAEGMGCQVLITLPLERKAL